MKGSERTVLSGDVNVSYRKKNFLFRNILSVSNTRSDNSPWGDFGDYARMNPYWSAVDPQTGQIARWAYDEVATAARPTATRCTTPRSERSTARPTPA